MGVIRNSQSLNSSFDQNHVNDILDNIDNQHDDINQINNVNNLQHQLVAQQEDVGQARRERQRNKQLKKCRSIRPEPTYRGLGIRGKSYKKHRRFENANLLSREYEQLSDGEELNDISIYDFIPQTVSAFAQLLMEKENMQTWNKLINCTEEQQEEILAASEEAEAGGSTDNEDQRKKKPAFSADECFKRIDADLKNLLKKKHLPLGVLAAIEEEITNFFDDYPSDTYKSCLPSGYQRLLLHACCQYMDLACLSFNKDGERWSKVENPNEYFGKPTMMLAKYLEMIQSRKNRKNKS